MGSENVTVDQRKGKNGEKRNGDGSFLTKKQKKERKSVRRQRGTYREPFDISLETFINVPHKKKRKK